MVVGTNLEIVERLGKHAAHKGWVYALMDPKTGDGGKVSSAEKLDTVLKIGRRQRDVFLSGEFPGQGLIQPCR